MTFAGIVIESNDLQPAKARVFIDLTVYEKFTDVRLEKFSKAELPIDVTPISRTILFIDNDHKLQGGEDVEKSSMSPVPEIVSLLRDRSKDHVKLFPHVPFVSARISLIGSVTRALPNPIRKERMKTKRGKNFIESERLKKKKKTHSIKQLKNVKN